MSVTIDDCVAKLRNLREKKVKSKPITKRTPSEFALQRLVTVGRIEAHFTPAREARDVKDRDALLYWDNALCMQNPHLQPLITATRHRELMASLMNRKVPVTLEEIVFL